MSTGYPLKIEIDPKFALDPEITRKFTANTFPGWLGFEILELGPERTIGRMVVSERHLHNVAYMHAGAWTAFADSIAGWGAARVLPVGWNFTTAEMKTNIFHTAAVGDELMAVALPLHVGKRTHVWEVRIARDDVQVANFICTQVLLEPKGDAPKKSTSEVPPEAVGREGHERTPEVQPLEIPQGPYATHLGIDAIEISKDRAVGRMLIDERHLHSGKFMHGGVWATLGDTVAGWATRENLREGQVFSSSDLKVNVIGAGKLGMVLDAEATPLHVGARTQVWMVAIRSEGKIVAEFMNTQMVLTPDPESFG
ncbi:MAG: hotdog fold thioesterase [Thermoleophilaceae bacterium]|nr:hotdog fold thioesterase [Thermoleophilaceae bacterium]